MWLKIMTITYKTSCKVIHNYLHLHIYIWIAFYLFFYCYVIIARCRQKVLDQEIVVGPPQTTIMKILLRSTKLVQQIQVFKLCVISMNKYFSFLLTFDIFHKHSPFSFKIITLFIFFFKKKNPQTSIVLFFKNWKPKIDFQKQITI